MEILRVAQTVYPDVKGGGAYHVHAMSRDQAAMGHDVTVVTVGADGDCPRRDRRDGYTLVRLPSTATVFGNKISTAMARYLRRADGFDVVHAHSHIYFSTNLAALRRRLGGPPLAVTNHGLYSQTAPEWVFDLYLHSLGRWTFNRADVVFCYTDEDAERIAAYGVDTRFGVVPNGVDTDRFTPDGPRSDLIDHDGTVVLFVGRLVDGKRPQDAVDAVAALPDRLDAKLYVVGDGPLREPLEARADPETVTFLEHVPYDQMPAVYRSGDTLLLPSRAEGLPRTVLEAFASETPAVTSRLPQTAEIVESGGRTVPVGDVTGYAEALERVLDDREALGRSGRETVLDRFQWRETVAETTDHLASLR